MLPKSFAYYRSSYRRARWPFRDLLCRWSASDYVIWRDYIRLTEIGNHVNVRSTFSWILLKRCGAESPKIVSRSVPSVHESRFWAWQTTDRQTTDGRRTHKHQILGTLYTKGPKGQQCHTLIKCPILVVLKCLRNLVGVKNYQSVYYFFYKNK